MHWLAKLMLAVIRIKSDEGMIPRGDQDGISDLIYSSFVASTDRSGRWWIRSIFEVKWR